MGFFFRKEIDNDDATSIVLEAEVNKRLRKEQKGRKGGGGRRSNEQRYVSNKNAMSCSFTLFGFNLFIMGGIICRKRRVQEMNSTDA